MRADDAWIEARARHLRRHLEEAEVVVLEPAQEPVVGRVQIPTPARRGRAILDFYCPEKRLAVEVDGPTHIESDDARRDARLAQADIEVVRITNEDVYRDSAEAMAYVLERLQARPLFNGRRRLT